MSENMSKCTEVECVQQSLRIATYSVIIRSRIVPIDQTGHSYDQGHFEKLEETQPVVVLHSCCCCCGAVANKLGGWGLTFVGFCYRLAVLTVVVHGTSVKTRTINYRNDNKSYCSH